MKIDFFLKSFKPDFYLLQFALLSIKKWITGYNNIILLIPEKDKHDFDTRNLPERTLIYYVEDKSPGWLYQQVCKLDAHKYSNADYIMFSDSDCIATRPVNIQDCIKDGRPEILYTDWSSVGDAICWRKPTEEIMGETILWEGMRRNNQVMHRDTLVNISNWRPKLEETILSMDRFSEFNLMSAFAYKYEREKYRFTDTANWTYVPPLMEQVWSHGHKKSGASDNHLREYIRTLETIIKSFGTGINLPE